MVETFVPGAPFISHGAIWLAVLVSGTLCSWILAPLACWAALHRGADPRAAATARWLFALLPAGALVALLVDIVIATVSGTEGPFIAVMTVATVVTFVVTVAASRMLAVNLTRRQP